MVEVRKTRPQTIEVVKWTGHNLDEIIEFIRDCTITSGHDASHIYPTQMFNNAIFIGDEYFIGACIGIGDYVGKKDGIIFTVKEEDLIPKEAIEPSK